MIKVMVNEEGTISTAMAKEGFAEHSEMEVVGLLQNVIHNELSKFETERKTIRIDSVDSVIKDEREV